MVRWVIVTDGLAPGMWAVVSRVVSWEWLESSRKVHWLVETFLPPHVVRSAIPAIVSMEPAADDSQRSARPRQSVRKGGTRQRTRSTTASAA